MKQITIGQRIAHTLSPLIEGAHAATRREVAEAMRRNIENTPSSRSLEDFAADVIKLGYAIAANLEYDVDLRIRQELGGDAE